MVCCVLVDPPLGHGGRGAPLVSFHARPQYPESESARYAAFWSFLRSGPLAVRWGPEHRKLQITAYHRDSRSSHRGRRPFRDQGGPPPTMPYAPWGLGNVARGSSFSGCL